MVKLTQEAIQAFKAKLGNQAKGASMAALSKRTLAGLTEFSQGLTVKEMIDHLDIGCPRKIISDLRRLKGYPISDYWEVHIDSWGNERRFKRYFLSSNKGVFRDGS